MVLQLVNLWIEFYRHYCTQGALLVSRFVERLIVRYHNRLYKIPNGGAQPPASGLKTAENPHLRATNLSFYDDFHIMSGIPVFLLDPEKSPGDSSCITDSASLNSDRQDPDIEISFFENRSAVTCCSFSVDDSRLASGHNDGSTMVWSTDHGTVLYKNCEGHRSSPVANIQFLKDSNSIVVSCDFHGNYIYWDLNKNECPIVYSCRRNWEHSLILSPTVRWPIFSEDATKLVYPITHHQEYKQRHLHFDRCCSICVFNIEDELVEGDIGYALAERILVVQSSNDFDFASMVLSNSNRGILVGLHAMPEGFSVVWTDLENESKPGLEITGTLGCWSQDDEYIATWDVSTKGSQGSGRDACYIWKVDDLRECAPMGSFKSTNNIVSVSVSEEVEAMELSDPHGGNVFWAKFVEDSCDSRGVAVCVVNETVEIIMWQLPSQNILHRLSTGITKMETRLTDISAWDDCWVRTQLSYGLNPFSMSGDGHWLGVFAASANKGIVWNPLKGIEVLRFSLPDRNPLDPSQVHPQMDMMFAKSGGRFALFSEDQVMLWNVPALASSREKKGVNRVALPCKDPSIDSGQVLCNFSYDGRMVGLCRAYSLMMTVWNLDEGWSKTLVMEEGDFGSSDWAEQDCYYDEMKDVLPGGNGRRFCLFAFSKDGNRLATCMGDMKVWLWNLGGDGEKLKVPIRIAVLRSNYLPAWDVGFTVNEDGNESVVVCEDLGVLLWIDIEARKIVERQNADGNRRATFSQDCTRGVLMPSNDVAHVWDLVGRVKLSTITFDVWMGITGPLPFPQNISMDAKFAFAGIGVGDAFQQGSYCVVKCEENTTEVELQTVEQVPKSVHLMEISDWAVVDSFCDVKAGDTSSQDVSQAELSRRRMPRPSGNVRNSFKIPSAAEVHRLMRGPTSLYGGGSRKIGKNFTKLSNYSFSKSSSKSASTMGQEGVTGVDAEGNGYPPRREFVPFSSITVAKRSRLASREVSVPEGERLAQQDGSDGLALDLKETQHSDRFPDLEEFFSENSWKYLLDYSEDMFQESDSLTVLHADGEASTKLLEGPGLLPHKFISTSADGCRVACLSSNRNLIVWTPFATMGTLPDWNDLVVTGMGAKPDLVEALLDEHGPGVMNCPDHVDLTIPFHTVLARDHSLLETMVSWAIENDTKMHLSAELAHRTKEGAKTKSTTVLDLAVAQRAPECVELLLTNIPRGLGTVMATASIYRNSLSNLCKSFPRVFHRILSSDALLVSLPEIRVPENIFSINNFLATTSDMIFPRKDQVESMWMDHIERHESKKLRILLAPIHETKMVTAVPKVVLYPGIALVGKKGLLKQMKMLPRSSRDDRMYGSFLMKALIHCKWTKYGHRLMVEEMGSFILLWVLFAIYALILASHWRLKIPQDGREGSSDGSTSATVLIVICWVLGLLHVVREACKICRLYIEDGVRGLWHWSGYLWNWMSITAYLLLVICIGPLHLFIASQPVTTEQHGQRRLTVLVAVECILLSWKFQNFAQAFRSTAVVVIMIQEILKAVFMFLFIAFLLLLGFAMAFYVLFRVELKSKDPEVMAMDPEELERYNEFDDKFGSMYQSMVTAFVMMLGETQIETFNQMTGSIRVVGTVMCIVYLLAMMVVLLNLLIAVMGDSFERVKNNEEIQFVEGRATAISDVEALMSEKKIEELSKDIGRYLHVLVRKTESTASGEWKGRLMEQNRLFKIELDHAIEELTGKMTTNHEQVLELLREALDTSNGLPCSMQQPPAHYPGLTFQSVDHASRLGSILDDVQDDQALF